MASWTLDENPEKLAAFGASARSSIATMLPSEPVIGVPPGAPVVTVTSGSITSSSVAITWTAPSTPSDAPIQAYEVWLQRDIDPPVNIADVAATVRSYSYSGLSQATRYTLFVNAVNKWGVGPMSNKPTITTAGGALPGPPGTPTVVSGSLTNTSVGLQWAAAIPPAGTTISDYRIYGGPSVVTSGGALTKAVTGLAAGTTYNFTVRAVGTNGEGPASAAVPVTTTGTPPSGGTTVLYAAGDVAHTTFIADAKRTSDLIVSRTDKNIVLALGDLAYSMGSLANYTQLYHPTWGRFKDITYPVPGNHETPPELEGYKAYWGSRVLQPGGGAYYSFIRGTWLFLAMDSSDAQGTAAGSGIEATQVTWAQNVIDNAPSTITGILAYWHHPRFSSGDDGNNLDTGAMVNMLRSRNADIVLCGHDHNYERFAKLNAAGTALDSGGIRHFTVGTGGSGPRGFSSFKFGTQKYFGSGRDYAAGRRNGVLRLALSATGYSWQWFDASSPAGNETDIGSDSVNPK